MSELGQKPAGGIPQSNALAEAQPESLAELFSRDPEGLSRQDRDRIVEQLRLQRERLAAAEAAGGPRPKAATAKAALGTKATKGLDDMGL